MSTHRPSTVFVSETRQNKDIVKNLRWRLGLKNCLLHNGKGKVAGIALYWDDSVEIMKLSIGPRYINVLVRNNPCDDWWRGTLVYGEPKAHERHHMWDLLARIKPNAWEPWFMIGDFNETMWQSEHFSSAKRSENNMANFLDILWACDLHGLGFRGPSWTYDNKQSGSNKVRDRIDRGVASPEWSKRLPNASIQHVVSTRSDHFSLLLQLGKHTVYRRKKIFRYEVMWERGIPCGHGEQWLESGGQGHDVGTSTGQAGRHATQPQ